MRHSDPYGPRAFFLIISLLLGSILSYFIISLISIMKTSGSNLVASLSSTGAPIRPIRDTVAETNGRADTPNITESR
jgi:hypothetical protein